MAHARGAGLAQVERGHAVAGLAAQPLRVRQRGLHVAHAGLPVFAHRGAGELVVLGVALVGPPTVDEVHDVDGRVRELRAQGFHARVALQRGRKFSDQVGQGLLQVDVGRQRIGVHARAAGVHDVLLALRHFRERGGHGPPCAEQVHLQHHQRARAGMHVEHVLQRRVRHHAAVPVVFAVDVHRREPRGQGAAGHDVLGADRLLGAVEVHRIAGAHVDGAHAEPHLAVVDAVEIDQPLQRALEGAGVVVAGHGGGGAQQQGGVQARLEEAGDAEQRAGGSAPLVEQGTVTQVLRHLLPEARGHEVPELLQARDTVFRRVAGDERRVDGADRDARDPVEGRMRVEQCLVHPRLVGAQGATALEDEGAVCGLHVHPGRGRACARQGAGRSGGGAGCPGLGAHAGAWWMEGGPGRRAHAMEQRRYCRVPPIYAPAARQARQRAVSAPGPCRDRNNFYRTAATL